MDFVGIDLEWASDVPGNVCEIGVVVVKGGVEVAAHRSLVRPILEEWGTWQFLNLPYGLDDAMNGPEFPDVWHDLLPQIKSLPWVAHNAAAAEARMLGAALAHHGLAAPAPGVVWCSLDLAKSVWPEFSAHGLHRMAERLQFDLEHHNPESDARACARLVVEAASRLGADGFAELAQHTKWKPHQLNLVVPELPSKPTAPEVFGVTLTQWKTPREFTGWNPGDRFVMSGLPEAQKRAIQSAARKHGLKPVQTVNGKTAFVIAGNVMGPAKYKRCQAYEVPIISAEEWERWGGASLDQQP